MTHTTAKRIEKQLNDIHDTYPGSVYDCFRVIAKEIAAEIDALTAERDEARAQYRREKTITATLEHQLSGWNESYLKVEAERDEARAEVERLRPAAEAWEAAEAWRAVGMHIENRRGRDDAYQVMDRAAARARAAKESL